MRGLARNKSTIQYILYESYEEEQDSNGYYTGAQIPRYSDPVSIRASVSASRGTSEVDLFGINVPYTHTIIVDDMTCPVDENSIFYISGKPYAVLLVAKSLNHITYAVRKMNDNEAPAHIIVSG